MDMNKTLGILTASIDNLKVASEKSTTKLESKLEKVEEKVTGIERKIYAATIVLGIVTAAGVWVVNKAWDVAIGKLQAPDKTQQAAPPTTQPPGNSKP